MLFFYFFYSGKVFFLHSLHFCSANRNEIKKKEEHLNERWRRNQSASHTFTRKRATTQTNIYLHRHHDSLKWWNIETDNIFFILYLLHHIFIFCQFVVVVVVVVVMFYYIMSLWSWLLWRAKNTRTNTLSTHPKCIPVNSIWTIEVRM